MVHATFQRYTVDHSLQGKRARFRWAGGPSWEADGMVWEPPATLAHAAHAVTVSALPVRVWNFRPLHCREYGLWFVDSERYFAPPGARWLTYNNTARQYVDALSAQASERARGAELEVEQRLPADCCRQRAALHCSPRPQLCTCLP